MKCRVWLCGAAWDCRREVYDLQMSEFSFGFCISVIPCWCNLYRFPLERVHAVRHWHLNSRELPLSWELRPLSPLHLTVHRQSPAFWEGTGAFEPNTVFCTLLTEKRLSPAPRAWPAMLGTPEKKGSLCTKGEGADSGRAKEFQECDRPGALPGWGCSGKERSLVSINNPGSAGLFIQLYVAH